jgi:hypothetical protein
VTVVVRGLRELQRDLGRYAVDVKKDLRRELQTVAEPIRTKAQGLAVSNIRNIGPTWERMRIGVIARGVYLAPKSRRRGGSPRPNLAPLLLDKAMQPAVDGSEAMVVAALEVMLDRVGAENGF